MEEHLATIDITGANTVRFAVPVNGGIKGVYSTSPVTLAYEDNGSIGVIKTNATEWEPIGGFRPAAGAYLNITSAASAKVTIRYEK